jgi:hypothetical protein
VPRETHQVDPRTLRLTPERRDGADPYKLARQKALHGDSLAGMPPIEVDRCKDGELVIVDGATRATRAAELHPGVPVPVVIDQERPTRNVSSFPTIGDTLP